ncbi:hypothetical protein E1B28_008618 [Marasmius oreades]|uniref:NYN domain-containing protein n=1 Tax=Marasmius oreades TaxID=181124 RepID=A0A9P7USB0_9AGAR|nr:uncharacterized protein E1B28_008618 [Marasmius oreades]KAG7092253.1 hypothetical protein E1B28_008618 [Marasmius oreades]
MLAFAIDNEYADSTILLISGDRDFAYPISILRFRMYHVVVISPSAPGAHLSLRAQASTFLDWNVEILNNLRDDRVPMMDPELPINDVPLPPQPTSASLCNTSRFTFTMPPSNFTPRTKQRGEVSVSAPINEGVTENVPPMYTPNIKTKTDSVPSRTPSAPPITPPTTTPVLDPIAQHVFTGLQQQLISPGVGSTSTPALGAPSLFNLQSEKQSGDMVELDIPPHIQSLVRTLQKFHENGAARPLRSVIALELVQKDGMVYRKAGVTKFREFCALAINAGFVVVGGTGGNAWISLSPDVLARLQSKPL